MGGVSGAGACSPCLPGSSCAGLCLLAFAWRIAAGVGSRSDGDSAAQSRAMPRLTAYPAQNHLTLAGGRIIAERSTDNYADSGQHRAVVALPSCPYLVVVLLEIVVRRVEVRNASVDCDRGITQPGQKGAPIWAVASSGSPEKAAAGSIKTVIQAGRGKPLTSADQALDIPWRRTPATNVFAMIANLH